MFSPCTTGVVVKLKVIVALPLLNVNESAGVPLTVKSVASTVAGTTGSLRLIMKSVGAVLTTKLPQAGSELTTERPSGILS